MRKALSALVGACFVLLAACGSDVVKASDYNQDCSTPDDCVGIVEGTGCCECDTATGAINKKDLASYQKDFADKKAKCGQCDMGPCFTINVTITCNGGKCGVQQ